MKENCLENLQTIGLTESVSETAAEGIWGELLIVKGKVARGEYDLYSYKHLHATYDAIAERIVRHESPDSVLEEMIPAMVYGFEAWCFWKPRTDSWSQMPIIRGSIDLWKGKRSAMKSEVMQRHVFVDDHIKHRAEEAALEEHYKNKRLRELMWDEGRVEVSNSDLARLRQIVDGHKTEATGSAQSPSQKVEGKSFPQRAAWMATRLKERAWDHNSLWSRGGPDRKTVLKILDGKYVRAEVFPRLIAALNHQKIKGVTVALEDIPSD